MAETTLTQDPTIKKIYFGWYGTCDTPCSDTDILSSDFRQYISFVYEVRSDFLGYSSFNGVAPAMFDRTQAVTKFECGKVYLIILKTGDGSFVLPNFVNSTVAEMIPNSKITANC
jgi:hypothetical protein